MEQGAAGGVYSWVSSPGHGLGGCRMQTRSSIVVVGASLLWSREDATGAKSVRFPSAHGILNRVGLQVSRTGRRPAEGGAGLSSTSIGGPSPWSSMRPPVQPLGRSDSPRSGGRLRKRVRSGHMRNTPSMKSPTSAIGWRPEPATKPKTTSASLCAARPESHVVDRLASVNTVGGQGKSGAKPARSRHCDRGEGSRWRVVRRPLGATQSPREGAADRFPEARRPVPGQP